MPFDRADSSDLLSESKPKSSFADFVDGGLLAFDEMKRKPVETVAFAAAGVAVGGAIQFGLNRAESIDGAVGNVSRLAKRALLPGTLAIAGAQVLFSENQMKEAGKQVVDAAAFVGLAKIGSYAVTNVPLLKSVMGPKLSENGVLEQTVSGPRSAESVSRYLKFETVGNDRVKILRESIDVDDKTLVRLSNEKGFFVHSRDREGEYLRLYDFPSQTPMGRLEYSGNTATLRAGDTTYTNQSYDGSLVAKRGDDVFKVRHGDLVVYKGDAKTTFSKDGHEILIGSHHSGQKWTFNNDGSISVRSMPYGMEKLEIAADGVGTYVWKYGGSSRGLAGRSGPRSNATEYKVDTEVVRLSPDRSLVHFHNGSWTVPQPAKLSDGTDVAKAIADFQKVDDLFRDLFKNKWRSSTLY